MNGKVFVVLFDAKIKTSTDKRQYLSFVKLLKRDGFTLLQKSVYIKFCVESLSLKSQSCRIKNFTPVNIQAIILAIPVNTLLEGAYLNCESPEFIENKKIICI